MWNKLSKYGIGVLMVVFLLVILNINPDNKTENDKLNWWIWLSIKLTAVLFLVASAGCSIYWMLAHVEAYRKEHAIMEHNGLLFQVNMPRMMGSPEVELLNPSQSKTVEIIDQTPVVDPTEAEYQTLSIKWIVASAEMDRTIGFKGKQLLPERDAVSTGIFSDPNKWQSVGDWLVKNFNVMKQAGMGAHSGTFCSTGTTLQDLMVSVARNKRKWQM